MDPSTFIVAQPHEYIYIYMYIHAWISASLFVSLIKHIVANSSVYKPPSHDAWRGLEIFQGKGLRRGGWVGTPATARRADLPVSQTDDSRLGGHMGAALWDDPLKYSVHAMFTYRASCTSYTPSVCACIHIYT